jgi:hypothetical protein
LAVGFCDGLIFQNNILTRSLDHGLLISAETRNQTL